MKMYMFVSLLAHLQLQYGFVVSFQYLLVELTGGANGRIIVYLGQIELLFSISCS